MICSGQISRDDALIEINSPAAPTEMCKSDLEYVLKRLGIPASEYINIISEQPKKFSDYQNSDKLWKRYSKIVNLARSYITRVD